MPSGSASTWLPYVSKPTRSNGTHLPCSITLSLLMVPACLVLPEVLSKSDEKGNMDYEHQVFSSVRSILAADVLCTGHDPGWVHHERRAIAAATIH